MPTAEQFRAARAMLEMKSADAAKAAGVGWTALKGLESGTANPRQSTVDTLTAYYESQGLMFVAEGDTRTGGPGVRRQP